MTCHEVAISIFLGQLGWWIQASHSTTQLWVGSSINSSPFQCTFPNCVKVYGGSPPPHTCDLRTALSRSCVGMVWTNGPTHVIFRRMHAGRWSRICMIPEKLVNIGQRSLEQNHRLSSVVEFAHYDTAELGFFFLFYRLKSKKLFLMNFPTWRRIG